MQGAVSRLDKKIGPLQLMLAQKKMSRRVLLEVAEELEDAAGLLRSIAGVSTNEHTERSGSTD